MLPGTQIGRIGFYATLTPLLLAGAVAIAAAQVTIQDLSQDDRVCTSSGGGLRIAATCDDGEKPTILPTEAEVTTTVQTAPSSDAPCSDAIALEYSQRDSLVHVQGNLRSETCAASTGQYEIAAIVRDENGGVETLRFSETWERSNNQPVMFTADYPIGENVELIRLNYRVLRCTCADTAEE